MAARGNTLINLAELFSVSESGLEFMQREVAIVLSKGKIMPIFLASIKNLFDTEKYLIKLTNDPSSEFYRLHNNGYSYVWKVDSHIPDESVMSFTYYSQPSHLDQSIPMSNEPEILWGIIQLAGSVNANKEIILKLDYQIRNQRITLLAQKGVNVSMAYSLARLNFMAKTGFLRNMAFTGLGIGKIFREHKAAGGPDAVLRLIEDYVHFDGALHWCVLEFIMAMGYVEEGGELERDFLRRRGLY